MGKGVRIGLIGAGRIGQVHAESISRAEPAALAAVVDVDLARAQKIGLKHHVSPVSDDYRSVLADDSIDAVAICSSTDTHAQLIIDAAQAGKHIFCEKPIDHSLEKIDAALDAVKTAGVKLQVGFNRRFDANFRKVRQMVVDGKVGRPQILRITSRDPAPPPIDYVRVSGGIFLDMTIHDFDMARYLMGSEIVEVFAAGGVLVDPAIGEAGDLDTAIITLTFADGAFGAIDNSRQAVYGYDQRVELFGSAGMVKVTNNYPNTHTYFHAGGVESEKPLYFFLERYMDSFAAEMQAFVDCVRNDTEPEVTGADGRIPVLVGLAAQKSWEENRPVAASEIGG